MKDVNGIKIVEEGLIFDNPMPQLRSRHGYFPGLVQLDDGEILATYALGEAFESVDLNTVLARSRDGGRTWTQQGPVLAQSAAAPATAALKLSRRGDGRLVAFGYLIPRPDPDKPMGNPETGGGLDDEVILLESGDGGRSWGPVTRVDVTLPGPIEASAPLTFLPGGWMVSPITNFPGWDGRYGAPPCGRLLMSRDGGATWSDDAVTMDFAPRAVTAYEQRLCRLDDGRLVVVGWNEDTQSGQRLPNHYVISRDNGLTFSEPRSTGVMGQATGLMALDGGRLLAMHCLRRDTDQPGIYAYVAEPSEDRWQMLAGGRVWGPAAAAGPDSHMADIFACLRFGQPSAIRLQDGDVLMTYWRIDNGQGKVAWMRLRLEV